MVPHPDHSAAWREARFKLLWDGHYDAVLAYARRRAPDTAPDIVAETFAVAWRKLDSIKRSDERPWLYGVARNVIKNDARATRRRAALVERLRREPTCGATSDSVLDRAAPIASALAHLSEADREVILLVAWEGLDVSAAAIALGCTAATARVRLHRARRRLHRRLCESGTPREAATPSIPWERA